MFKLLILYCSKYLFLRMRFKQLLLRYNPDIRELLQLGPKQVAIKPKTSVLLNDHHGLGLGGT